MYNLKTNSLKKIIRNQIHKKYLKKNTENTITKNITNTKTSHVQFPLETLILKNGNKTTHTYSSRRPLAARATDRLTGSEQNHYITKLPTNQWRHEPKFSTVALCVQ